MIAKPLNFVIEYISEATLLVDADKLESFLASRAQARAQGKIVCPPPLLL